MAYNDNNNGMYNQNGSYNPNGYNQNGYNPNGYNQNQNGYYQNNPNGYNPNGYNQNGYNPNGYNQNQNNNYNLNGNNYAGTQDTTQNISKALSSSFLYMFVALLITAITAFTVVGTGAWVSIFSSGMIWLFVVLEFVVVIAATFAIKHNNVVLSAILFVAYSIVNGVTLSSILLVYSIESISYVFLITAGIFGIMAFLGAVTKINLSSFGSILIMGLFAIIITSLVNVFFLHSESLDFAICIVGVLIFVGLTAYDTQKIKKMAAANTGYSIAVIGLWGALELYLDFINLFLKLLRLFGKARN